jgi:hypothetical protein
MRAPGGERAYGSRLGKDRSPRDSGHTVAAEIEVQLPSGQCLDSHLWRDTPNPERAPINQSHRLALALKDHM